MNVIGKPLRRVDGRAKVTGQTRFADDLAMPGMLFMKLLRSTVPHAKIRKIDTRRAEQYPGVTVDAWFTEYAIVEDGRTWILRRVWGRATEPTLIALSEAFPAAKVTFRQASSA